MAIDVTLRCVALKRVCFSSVWLCLTHMFLYACVIAMHVFERKTAAIRYTLCSTRWSMWYSLQQRHVQKA
jgi:hypothetical protein